MSEAIVVRGLTKAYHGKTVVDQLDLSVRSVHGIRAARRKRCRKKHHDRVYARHKAGR